MTPKQQRYARIAQAKHRKSRSTKTELENAQLLLAWEARLIDEREAAQALGVDHIALQVMRRTAMDAAMQVARALSEAPT